MTFYKLTGQFLYVMIITLLITLTGCQATPGKKQPKALSQKGWTLQFSDDFEREKLGKNWDVWSGNWHIKDGWLTITRTGLWGSDLICTKEFPGEQRLEFDAKSDNPGDLSGLINTSKYGVKTGYFFGFGSKENTIGALRIEGREKKEYEAIIEPGKVHHQIIQRKGKILTHIVDGKTVLRYKHPHPLNDKYHQRIGLYVFTQGQFDNVKVYTRE